MERYALELAVLLGMIILGTGTFAVFEGETQAWRKIFKWSTVTAATLGASHWIGHAAIAIPVALGLMGLAFHFWWCRTNGIHPIHATPRRKYYALRGWTWPE